MCAPFLLTLNYHLMPAVGIDGNLSHSWAIPPECGMQRFYQLQIRSADDTVVFDMKSKQVTDWIRVKVGRLAFCTGGQNTGRVGLITKVDVVNHLRHHQRDQLEQAITASVRAREPQGALA